MHRFYTYFYAARLPLFLAVLLVVQTVVFNSWVHLSPNPDLALLLLESFTLGVLLYGPSLFCGPRLRYLYLLGISIVISLIFISQYLYFSFYGGFLQASALEYANQVGAEWGTIVTLFTPWLFVFVLNVGVVLLAFVTRYKRTVHFKQLSGKEKLFAGVGILGVACLGYGMLLAFDTNGWQKFIHPTQTLHDLNSFTFSPNHTIENVGITNYYLDDIIGTLMRTTTVSASELVSFQDWYTQKPQQIEGKYFGLARGQNLIFVQVESLEAAPIGQKIGTQEITPNLNKLVKSGLYFDNYYTQVGPGNTADAEFVTLDSLYPLTNTVAFIDFANNTYTALPQLLVQNGYHTYALHGDVPDFWNRANIYPALGYQTEISKSDFTQTEAGFETLDDDDFLSQSAEKMTTFQSPFMTTVITLSSHTPFVIPTDYQTLQFPADSSLSDTQKDYLRSVHYTDAALGAFIQKLKDEGLYDNSLIAIFGDHGSSTGISGQVGTTTDRLAGLVNSHVPLLLLDTKLNASLKGATDIPGSHLDLYPTVADLLGIAPPLSIFGQDLLSTKTPLITHRDPYTAIITTILTPTIAYEAADSGVFTDGTCISMPTKKVISLASCAALYNAQSVNITTSDLIVRGNLLQKLLTKTSTATSTAH